MRQGRRPPLSAREVAAVSGIVVASVVIVGALAAANIRWSQLTLGGGNFFAAWNGARAFLIRGDDPYGAANAVATQMLHYGQPAPSHSNPFRLDIPFFLLPVYFPLALIPDPAVARGLWATVSQMAIVGVVFLTLEALDLRPPRALVAATSILAAFSVYSVEGMLDGTPVILLTLGYMAILWSIRTGRDELAGFIAALCLFMWEVGLPFLVLTTWRIFHERRWRVLAGLGMALVVLLTVSFFTYPGWVLPYLTSNVGALRTTYGLSTFAALTRLAPDHGNQFAQALSILVLGTLVYEWAKGRESDSRRFVWNACLVLAATPLIGFRMEIGSLVILMPSFVVVAAAAVPRRPPASWLGILFVVLLFVLPWYFAWAWFGGQDQLAPDILFLLAPSMGLLTMYWTRWWFLRPPRTWMDEVRAAR